MKSIEYLIDILGDFIEEPKLILVAGHPGSGKTTLASSICLYALKNNEKCLYVSFQEDKEKLFKQLEGVGIDFKAYDEKNSLKFVKIPVVASSNDIQLTLDILSKLVLEHSPRVVVVDSVTPLLETVESNAIARGYLQNFFWELQKTVGGAVVLVSEIPLGREYASMGWIEFVADAVLILKHRIRSGLIERILEIRKVRGKQLTVSELHFSIISGKGIIIHRPVHLETYCSPILSKRLPVFKDKDVDVVEVSSPSITMYFEYPPETSPWVPIVFSILIHMVEKNPKILFIDFSICPTSLTLGLMQMLKNYGADSETITKILRRIVFRTINPSAYSLSELISYIISLIDDVKPTALYIHNDAIAWMSATEDPKEYTRILNNFVFELRARGVDIFRISSFVDPIFSNINKILSSYVVTMRCTDIACSSYTISIEKSQKVAGITLSLENLEEITRKLIQLVKNLYKQEV
ncbi:MAG: ATPase domain-containing protein [Ignisphaera sp.]